MLKDTHFFLYERYQRNICTQVNSLQPIQYLHLWPLKTVIWTHKEIFGSEFFSFARFLLCCLYTASYSDCEAMAQISVTKKRSFWYKKDLFCYTFGLHLQSKCTPIAMQKDNFCKVKKPQMTSCSVFVAPKNYKTYLWNL